ncbi:uncharacterized protein LOC125554478 [Triticum urartu]|uniref:uncharacterized protein LOC125554478 n=1 Tax=Triticum urartu TaxID=4572 RepID=UPI002042C3AF|nr:uncharacterized protein LOC125554478 [Triticum urartu]
MDVEHRVPALGPALDRHRGSWQCALLVAAGIHELVETSVSVRDGAGGDGSHGAAAGFRVSAEEGGEAGLDALHTGGGHILVPQVDEHGEHLGDEPRAVGARQLKHGGRGRRRQRRLFARRGEVEEEAGVAEDGGVAWLGPRDSARRGATVAVYGRRRQRVASGRRSGARRREARAQELGRERASPRRPSSRRAHSIPPREARRPPAHDGMGVAAGAEWIKGRKGLRTELKCP